MNILAKVKLLFSRRAVKPTVNVFLQLQQIYSGFRHLDLSVINRVSYPVLYKDMADYKFTLDGAQYSVHIKELQNYGLNYTTGGNTWLLEDPATPEEYNSPINSGYTLPSQQYNISIWNRTVSINLMAGIDGQIKLNSNVQPSTVKSILSTLQDTINDALQVCAKYKNTKQVPIIVNKYGKKVTDEQAVLAGSELEKLYIS